MGVSLFTIGLRIKMFLYLSILFSLSISNALGDCPSGWVDAAEYDLGCLLLYNKENGNRLVEIYTPAQRDALTTILIEHNGLFYWVGASDARHEGTWLWGSGAAVEDFVWMKNQPSTSVLQNCMFWSWEGEGAGDDLCSFSIAIFPLCQMI